MSCEAYCSWIFAQFGSSTISYCCCNCDIFTLNLSILCYFFTKSLNLLTRYLTEGGQLAYQMNLYSELNKAWLGIKQENKIKESGMDMASLQHGSFFFKRPLPSLKRSSIPRIVFLFLWFYAIGILTHDL